MGRELKIGVARRNISPPEPKLLTIRGMSRTRPIEGVMKDNPLYAEAMAIEAGGTKAIIATSDTLFIRYGLLVQIRDAVAKKTGCDPKLVIPTSRHNHSSMARPRDKSAAARAASADAARVVKEGIIEACVDAHKNLRPAEVAAGAAELDPAGPVGLNRRMLYGHGAVMPAWGAGSVAVPGERFVGAGGAHPMRIDFLCAREPGKTRPFAILVSYAAHPQLSAMWYFSGEVPGAAAREIETRLEGTMVLYANGAAGDTAMHSTQPIPGGGPEAHLEWFRESARLLGRRFADALVPAVPRNGYARPDAIRHEYFSTAKEARTHYLRRTVLQALRLGDIGLLGFPNEMFIEFGLEMQARSPLEHLIILGYNGTGSGYTGPSLSYEQGGYETGRGPAPPPEEEERLRKAGGQFRRWGSRLHAGERITRKALEMLGRLAK